MVYENLDKNIAKAMRIKAECPTRTSDMMLNFWKSVKTEMVNAVHNGIELPNQQEELKILRRMLKQRKNAIDEFSKSYTENAKLNKEVNEFEADMLTQLLPPEPSEDDVKNETVACICAVMKQDNEIKNLQRHTKDIISLVKEKYTNADNGLIARTIKEYIDIYNKQ